MGGKTFITSERAGIGKEELCEKVRETDRHIPRSVET